MKPGAMGIVVAAMMLFSVAGEARARVAVGVGFRAPVFKAAPDLVLVPGASVYFHPGADRDVFFHAGLWWTPWEGRWYRAASWRGPWVIADARLVPAPIIRMPRDYRVVYSHHPRVPHSVWRHHPVHHQPALRHAPVKKVVHAAPVHRPPPPKKHKHR